MSDIQKHEHDGDIGCLEAIEWLYAWLDGELDEQSAVELEKHISHCSSCFSRRQLELRLTERMKSVSGNEPASAALRSRLDQLIEKL